MSLGLFLHSIVLAETAPGSTSVSSNSGTATVANIDSSLFYYTYSTIAQTLAGAFGFLAAVVLYRLQALSGQLQTTATQLIGDPRTFTIEPFRTLVAYQRWHLFVVHLKRDQDPSNRNPVFKGLNFLDVGAMDHANGQILTIRRWFMISMIGTVACIAICLIALFCMVWVQSLVFLGVMLVMALLCLVAYARLMFTVLD